MIQLKNNSEENGLYGSSYKGEKHTILQNNQSSYRTEERTEKSL